MAEIDPQLLRRAQKGDREAFWELVSPLRGLIYSVALGMLKDAERAEDQLHDVLVTAFKSIGNLRQPSKLASWLHSMTRFRTMELMRKEKRLRGVLERGGPELTRVVSVAELMDKERRLVGMEEALNRLPEPFRVILGMKYMNDLSCREIGEIMDISVSAVKSRLFEARKLLRKLTEAESDTRSEQGHEPQKV